MQSKKSQVYAQVLLELDSSSEFLKSLQSLFEILTETKVFSFFLSLNISAKEKKEILNKALNSAPKTLRNFFFVLLDNKSWQFLPDIVKAYKELLDEKNKTCRAEVSSSQKLSEQEKEDLKQFLGEFFNKKIEIQEKEDKRLIAGLLVNAGGYLFKANSQQYLNKFKKSGGF